MVLTSSGELKALILIGAVFVVGAIGVKMIFTNHTKHTSAHEHEPLEEKQEEETE